MVPSNNSCRSPTTYRRAARPWRHGERPPADRLAAAGWQLPAGVGGYRTLTALEIDFLEKLLGAAREQRARLLDGHAPQREHLVVGLLVPGTDHEFVLFQEFYRSRVIERIIRRGKLAVENIRRSHDWSAPLNDFREHRGNRVPITAFHGARKFFF